MLRYWRLGLQYMHFGVHNSTHNMPSLILSKRFPHNKKKLILRKSLSSIKIPQFSNIEKPTLSSFNFERIDRWIHKTHTQKTQDTVANHTLQNSSLTTNHAAKKASSSIKTDDLPKHTKQLLQPEHKNHAAQQVFSSQTKCIEKTNDDGLVQIYKQIRTITELRKLLVSMIDAFVFFVVLIGNCVATIIAYVINVVLLVSELWRPQQKQTKKA